MSAPPPTAPVTSTRSGRGETLAWFVLFGVAAILWTWPLVRDLRGTYLSPLANLTPLGQADVHLTTWILGWGSHALRTAPLDLFDTNAFHPLPNTLAFSEHLLAGALVLAPVDVVFGQHAVRDHNLLVLASFVGAGAGTALLARELGAGLLPAFLGGALFAFHGGRFASIIHVQTLSTHWMPFTLLFLHRLLRTGRVRDGLAFTACFLLALLSGVYWFYYFGMAVGLVIAADAACRCPAAPRSRSKALGFAALAGVLTIPVMLHYLQARDLYALGRAGGEAWFFAGKVSTYLGPLLFPGDWWAQRYGGGIHPYVLGPAAIALIAVALAGGAAPERGGRRRTSTYGLVLLGMVLVSLGPLMQTKDLLSPGIPGPHLLLERLVPGYSALRTPGRAANVAMLPAAVLAALGADWLRRRARSAAPRWMLAGLLLAVVVTEAWRPRLHAMATVAGGAGRSPAYAFLAAQPGGGAVIELPIGAVSDARAMALSTWHWRPLVNGYSGFTPTQSWLRAKTFVFPTVPSARMFWELGVRWIVVRPAEMFPGRPQQACAEPLPAEMATFMHRRFTDADLCIFEMTGEPPPPVTRPDRPVSLEGATITASSGDSAAMHDGDPTTHWTQDVTPHEVGFVQIELPTARRLTRVVLHLGPHFGEFTRHVQVEGSEDGERWQRFADHNALAPPLLALRDTPDALSSTIPLPGIPLRFLRLVRPMRGDTTAMDLFINWNRWGIHEIALYEAADPGPGT